MHPSSYRVTMVLCKDLDYCSTLHHIESRSNTQMGPSPNVVPASTEYLMQRSISRTTLPQTPTTSWQRLSDIPRAPSMLPLSGELSWPPLFHSFCPRGWRGHQPVCKLPRLPPPNDPHPPLLSHPPLSHDGLCGLEMCIGCKEIPHLPSHPPPLPFPERHLSLCVPQQRLTIFQILA